MPAYLVGTQTMDGRPVVHIEPRPSDELPEIHPYRSAWLTCWHVAGTTDPAYALAAILALAGDRWPGDGVTVTRLVPPAKTADELDDEADNRKRQSYFDDVRELADDLRQAIKDGEITTEEGARDWLHERLDSHRRVIYTSRAIECLLYSDHASAYVEEDGGDGVVKDDDINWSGLAYSAMGADVMDHLDALADEIREHSPIPADAVCYWCDQPGAEDDPLVRDSDGDPVHQSYEDSGTCAEPVVTCIACGDGLPSADAVCACQEEAE